MTYRPVCYCGPEDGGCETTLCPVNLGDRWEWRPALGWLTHVIDEETTELFEVEMSSWRHYGSPEGDRPDWLKTRDYVLSAFAAHYLKPTGWAGC